MNPADIAWILAATGLVFLIVPGLAFLYGGVLGNRDILSMLAYVFGAVAITAPVYVLIGHGLVLGNSVGGLGIIGNPFEHAGFYSLMHDDGTGSTLFSGFYFLFAAISVALVASGAAGRMRFGAWLAFAALWVVLVYGPLGHWVFSFSDPDTGYVGGWMRNVLGLHDFAGGTAVHMNAGASGLALALFLGRRKAEISRPHNVPMVLLGSGLIAVGWIGFNGGTAAGANFLAGYVTLTSLLAASTGMLGFAFIERIRDGHSTVLGMATGLIAGLVGITPAADAVSPVGALCVGFIAAIASYWAISWKTKHRIDDSLDVFAVHGIAGIAGALFVVFLGSPDAPAGIGGVLRGGDLSLIWRELTAIVVTLVFAFSMTYAIAWGLSKVMRLRVTEAEENVGLDQAIHAESGYGGRLY